MIDLAVQGKSLPKPVAGALDFKLHHRAEGGRVLLAGDIVFGDVEAAKIFDREIDAVLRVVDGNVLPEVGELQRGAGEVGKALALGVAISAEVEDEMSDGIRRVTAVGEDAVESLEPRDDLILTEGEDRKSV